MSTVPNRETFESAYAGKAPWDIGKPQPNFVAVADQVTGSILDAGCGTGENALFFAERGHSVLGIDFLAYPIEEAQRKTTARGLAAEFVVKDALALTTLDRRFDSVLDSGLFHVFSDDDRVRYVSGLTQVTNPGGRLFLLSFSDEEPGTHGPRRISQAELQEAFAHGWTIEDIQPTTLEIIPELKDVAFSKGGPKAWFSVIRREG